MSYPASDDDIVDRLEFRALYHVNEVVLRNELLEAVREIKRLRGQSTTEPKNTSTRLHEWWANLPA